MRKNILFRTNMFVCSIIIIGFIITSIISYRSNTEIYEADVAHVSDLVSAGMYYQVDTIFAEPINISLTMANDILLKNFLAEEEQSADDEIYLQKMREYLEAYRIKYEYDSVFLVSSQTNRYYHFNGLDRVIEPENSEDNWYYSFLESEEEFKVNIDNDKAANHEITVFIDARIKDGDGNMLGVVGVGFRVNHLQQLLKEYEDEFALRAYLVDDNGMITVSTEQTANEAVDFFKNCEYQNSKEEILASRDGGQNFWYSSKNGRSYIATRYIENLNWHLLIEKDTSLLSEQLQKQFLTGMFMILIIIAAVLFTITTVIRKYNRQIIELTTKKENEYYRVRREADKQLYENIYEIDITNNCALGESTERFFESLGVPKDTPYDEALIIIAEKQIKKEHRQGYLNTFSPEHVLEAYHRDLKTLRYDFMISNDGENYYWMRISACTYFWKDDKSIRMTIYRQNIDLEKQQEKALFEQMQSDPLTGLYNKAATQERIYEEIKMAGSNKCYAFFIVDIDNFKSVNDMMGHAAGDTVISQFAQALKKQFCEGDVVGRIGGDEFVAFSPISSEEWVEGKARTVAAALYRKIVHDFGKCTISASIGIAIYPEAGTDFETLYQNADIALYKTKKNGKNGYTVFEPSMKNND